MLAIEPHATDDPRRTRHHEIEACRSRTRGGDRGLLHPLPMTARAADEPRVSVEYDPYVSVAAREVGLGDLLRLIGAKVGFTVAEGPAASRLVTVSIASASVDDMLRQLLRAENHTILYRQGADAMVVIDRIVLLGAPAEGVPVASTGARPSQEAPAVASSASGIGPRPRRPPLVRCRCLPARERARPPTSSRSPWVTCSSRMPSPAFPRSPRRSASRPRPPCRQASRKASRSPRSGLSRA